MLDLPAPAATAARALLASLVRHALVAAGAALVTRGLVTQGQVDGILPTLVESIVGTLLVAGATGWAQIRAWLAHGRFAAAWAALNADAPNVHVVVQGSPVFDARVADIAAKALAPLTSAPVDQAGGAGNAA